MDRSFYCADMDTGSINQLEDICRQQSRQNSTRDFFRNMVKCANSIQSSWSHFKRNWAFNIHTIYVIVERKTQVITRKIKLAYNRGQITKSLTIIEYCRRYHNCRYLWHTGKWPSSLTRSWLRSDLLCDEGTTGFIGTRSQKIDGTRMGFNQHFIQIFASID